MTTRKTKKASAKTKRVVPPYKSLYEEEQRLLREEQSRTYHLERKLAEAEKRNKHFEERLRQSERDFEEMKCKTDEKLITVEFRTAEELKRRDLLIRTFCAEKDSTGQLYKVIHQSLVETRPAPMMDILRTPPMRYANECTHSPEVSGAGDFVANQFTE